MEKTTIPSVRAGSDITIGVRLKYSGVPIDWSGMSDVKALIYSDARKALSGRCLASVRTDDPTVLSCEYPARKQQYAGVNRILIQAKYQGRTCSFDKPAFNVVPRTALLSAPEVVVIDPSAEEAVEVDVTIEITEVTTGLLDRAIAAALKAADEAEEAAHLVPLQVLEDCREATGAAAAAKDAANAAAVHAIPYIGENGHWWKWDSEAGAYVDSGEEAKGDTGATPDISIGTVATGEPGTDAGATMTGTPEAPVLSLTIPRGGKGDRGKSAYEVAVEEGFVGTEADWLASLKGDTGVSADHPIPVHNGLDSDATGEALSALQGKILDGKVSQLSSDLKTFGGEIQEADFNLQDYSILISEGVGVFGTTGNYKHAALPVNPGEVYYLVGQSSYVRAAFATSDVAVGGGQIPVVSETGVMELSNPGEFYKMEIPEGCSFLLFNAAGTYGTRCFKSISNLGGEISNVKLEVNSLSVKAETDIYGSKYKYLEGFYLNSDGGKYSSSDSLISLDYIPVHTGQKITWHHGFDPVKAQASLIMYNSNHEKVGYYSSYVASERTIDVSLSSAAYIRASFSKTAIDAFVQINGKTVWKKQAKKGLKGDINKLNVVEYDPATIELLGGKIDSEGTWLNTTNWSHVRIPAKKGDKFHLFGANESRYAFIRWNVAPYTGDKAILTPGTLLTLLPAGVVTTITIPEDCRYLYLEAGGNGNTNLKRLNLPDSIVKETALFNNVEDLRDGKSSIGAMVSFVGAGDSYNTSYASRITDVLPGGTYRVHFLTKPEAHSGSSHGFARLRIWSIDASNTSTRLVEIPRSQELPDYIDISLPQDAVAISIGGRCAYGEVQEMMVEMLPSGFGGSGILDLNPDSEFIPKLLSVSKRYYTGSTTTKKKPLVIAHLSDIHGNWKNVERFLKFCDHHKQFVDLMVNTGDTVNNQYSQGIEGYSALEGVNNIINVVGNHDTYKGEDGISDVRYYVGLAAYNMLIAPFVSAWGVTQPDGAAENGYCYFFKDYVEKNIRLVFVDVIGYDEIQNTWLAAVLEDARSAGYHIAIFTHFNPARPYADRQAGLFEVIPCNFSTLYESGTSSSTQTSYNEHSYMMADAVRHFMANGGHFVGYFMGHYHKGFVARLVIYPDQLIYAVGASKAGEVSDYAHTLGTREQDEFYIIGIDPMNTLVKLLAVGANYDRYGRKKGSVCVDYSTGQVLGEGW